MSTDTQVLPVEAALVELTDYIASLPGGITQSANWPQIVEWAEVLISTLPVRYATQLAHLLEDQNWGFLDLLLPAYSLQKDREQLTQQLQQKLDGSSYGAAAANLVWLAQQRFIRAIPPWMFSQWAPETKCMWCDNLPRAHSDTCGACFNLDCAWAISAGYGDD